MNLDISLEEALLGYDKTINHLDGHSVRLRSNTNEIVQPFSVKIIRGEGMPIRGTGEFGDLHVKMIVTFP